MREDGFTLAETLAALVVIGFAFTLVAQLVSQHVRLQRDVRATRLILNEIVLTAPQRAPDLDADCVYDVLGGRCRS